MPSEVVQFKIAKFLKTVGRISRNLTISVIVLHCTKSVVTYVVMWNTDLALDFWNYLMKNVSRGVAPDYVRFERTARVFYHQHPFWVSLVMQQKPKH